MKTTNRRLAACIGASIVVQLLLLAWLARPVSVPLSLPTLEVLLVSPIDLNSSASAALPAQSKLAQTPPPANSANAPNDTAAVPEPAQIAAEPDIQPAPNSSKPQTGAVAHSPVSSLPIDFSGSISKPLPAAESPANALASANSEPASAGVVLAIRQRLAQFQSYPPSARRRGIEGAATVRFVIGQRGKLMDSELLESSGSRHLDQAALRLVADAAPYPPLPGSIGASRLEVKIPIEYRLQPPAI